MRILAAATDDAWVQRALADVDEILVDHAHCEKKAASTALSLLFRYPEKGELLVPLARLAQEELGHFAEVVEVLDARGVGLRHQVPSSYAGALMAAVRPALEEFVKFPGPAFLEVIVDPSAHVYPMVAPGMGYKDMITGKWIPSREAPREPGEVDPTSMF